VLLYPTYDWMKNAMAPWVQAATGAARALETGPWRHWPGSQAYAAWLEGNARAWQDYPKPEFGIHQLDPREANGNTTATQRLPVVEEVVFETAFQQLRRFRIADGKTHRPIVLVVAPMSGHHATLLRDTVRELVRHHTVYITDWKDARIVPVAEGEFSLDTYVSELDRAQQAIAQAGPWGCKVEHLHVLAVCQPVVPVLAQASLEAQAGKPTPASLILMGGPVDARLMPTEPNRLATDHDLSWFETNLVHQVPQGHEGAGRRVYPGFLQHMGFMAMNPGKHTQSHLEFLHDVWAGDEEGAQRHRDFYDEYNAVCDLHAPYYLQTIQAVFQDFDLPQGRLMIKGQRVDPGALKRTALLTIEGARDDIAGQGQTQAAQALCPGIPKRHKQHLLDPQAGHYGLFSGRRWREAICPQITQFIAARHRATGQPAD
jgi:poly(3-hydroxybutyrate) depolymerase